ncbi:hypothetical protein VTO73DRAFT_1836 [Trametes versicolor]
MSGPAESPDVHDPDSPDVNDPDVPALIDAASLAHVTFSPDGIDKVARYLRQDPLLHNAPRQVIAMTMAYFATGAFDDGQHDISRKRFHPTFRTFRHGYKEEDKHIYNAARDEFTRVVFDFLTTWDRLNEGVTYAVHTNATRRPNTPACPEEGIFDVYAPPHFIATYPEAGYALARMVQDFAENVGPDAMQRWDKLNYKDIWAKQGDYPGPRTPPTVLIPPSDTTRYLFHGRAPGTLEPLIDAYRATRPTATWSLHSLPPPPSQTAPRRQVTAQATQPSSSSRGQPSEPVVFTPPTSPERQLPARRVLPHPSTSSARPVGTITETDWEEGIKAHPRETYEYTDKILALQQKVNDQGSYVAVLDLELQRLRDENTRLFIENARLRMELPAVVVPPPNQQAVLAWSRLTAASLSQASTHARGMPVPRSTSTVSDVGGPGPVAESQAGSAVSRAPSAAPRAPPATPRPPSTAPRPLSTTPRRSSTVSTSPSTTSRPSVHSPRPSVHSPRPSVHSPRPSMHSPRPEHGYVETHQNDQRAMSPASTRTSAAADSVFGFEIVSPVEFFGEATANVFNQRGIDPRFHHTLWIIYQEVEPQKWRKSVRRALNTSDRELASTVVSAMLIDADYRRDYTRGNSVAE